MSQPATLHAADTRLAVARRQQRFALFDGVLYERQQVGDSGASDADLILRAYEPSAEAWLHGLSGIFTLVVHDERRAALVAARDRVGIYPLFYAETSEALLLSTSVETILADGRVSSELNRTALADHLAHRWPDPSETYYAAVRRVPPGHAFLVDADGRRVVRYWRPVEESESVDWVRPGELDEFETLLDQAVSRGLVPGRTGIFLSGGLDSVSVAAVATQQCHELAQPAPLALSVGFSTAGEDEQLVQRRVASDLGLQQLLIPLEVAAGPEGLVAAALELSAHWPVPLVNSLWLPAYLHLAREGRARDCDVILSGHGGDEWLTVTPYYAADLILAGDVRGLWRLWDNHRRSYPIPPARVLRSLLWQFGTRPLLGIAAERVAPEWKARRRRRRAVEALDWIAPDPALRRALEDRASSSTSKGPDPGRIYLSEMERALDHALIAMELEEMFECGRRLGLRFAAPFWDADLLAFLYRTPPELLNRGGRSKGLVRGMLAKRFPDLGFETHRKITGNTTARTLYVEEGRLAWGRLGGAHALEELGIVDGDRVRRLVEDLLTQSVAPEKNLYSYRVWDILTLEAWARAHV